MNAISSSSKVLDATQWLFTFYSGWMLLAAAGGYRILLGPSLVVAARGEDFTTELDLNNSAPREDKSRENLATSFKVWLVGMVAIDLFFALACGPATITVLQYSPVLGVAILLEQLLLIASLIIFSLGAFRDSVGDYTIERDRSAIDRNWQRQAAQVRIATRGIYLWLACMFGTTIWLYFLGRSLA